MASEAPAWGSPADYLPTLGAALCLSVLVGLSAFADATPFPPLLLLAGGAVGALCGAAGRLVLGREQGSTGAAAGIGSGLFVLVFAFALVAAMARGGGSFSVEGQALMGVVLCGLAGFAGTGLGALALAHTRAAPPASDTDTEDLDDDDVDYTTRPAELVCLLTNQVVNPHHDRFVVCHNRLNQTQQCHAVYLLDYAHLLEGRCRRCFQPLRERDRRGFGAG